MAVVAHGTVGRVVSWGFALRRSPSIPHSEVLRTLHILRHSSICASHPAFTEEHWVDRRGRHRVDRHYRVAFLIVCDRFGFAVWALGFFPFTAPERDMVDFAPGFAFSGPWTFFPIGEAVAALIALLAFALPPYFLDLDL